MEAGSRGHPLVFISSLLYLCGLIYGALGGAYFNILPVNVSENTKVLANSAADPNILFRNNNALAAVGVRCSCLIETLSLDPDSRSSQYADITGMAFFIFTNNLWFIPRPCKGGSVPNTPFSCFVISRIRM